VSGTLPYLATVYPLEGAVPAGQSVVSADDASLRASVLSTWPDGSAAVVVLAGETAVAAGSTKTISLQAGAGSGTALTAARIGQLLSSVRLNFPGIADVTFSNWGAPTKTWWANASVICCQYVVDIGTGLQASIYVQAFASSSRALVEFVIENGKVNADLASVPTPASVSYAGATLSVTPAGGSATQIGTAVSSPSAGQAIPNARKGGTFAGGHDALRAWHRAAWVSGSVASAEGGSADPQIDVTHDAASLQAHPWFWRPLEAANYDMQAKYTQAYDSYVPWATCRLRTPGMDGGGDDEQIALFTEEQCDYFQSGNRYARRAVLATGLALLTMDINTRHAGNGQVPTRAQVYGKITSNSSWPRLTNGSFYYGGENTRDGSHIPATTLVAFLCRPSPVFIEIAQKEFLWNHSNYGSADGGHTYDQVRSRAWRARNYAITIFLTPDADSARKDGYRAALMAKRNTAQAFFDQPWNTLGVLYGLTPTSAGDWDGSSRARMQIPMYMNWFCVIAWTAVDKAKVLRGADASAWAATTDTMAQLPVRYTLEATGGEWRMLGDIATVGDLVSGSPASINMGSGNWGAMTRSDMTGTLPPVAGPFLQLESSDTDWSQVTEWGRSGVGYDAQYFNALCAAVERGITGAGQAWDKLWGASGSIASPGSNPGITNLQTWRTQFANTPRFNRFLRNR